MSNRYRWITPTLEVNVAAQPKVVSGCIKNNNNKYEIQTWLLYIIFPAFRGSLTRRTEYRLARILIDCGICNMAVA